MKKAICLWALAIFIIFGCTHIGAGKSAADQTAPTVEASGPVKMDKKAKTTISGKGFKPGQELNVLLLAKDGVQTDIGYTLKPAPKADASGAWSSTWSAGDYIKRKMVKAGANKLTVTDSDYDPIVHTFVTFTK